MIDTVPPATGPLDTGPLAAGPPDAAPEPRVAGWRRFLAPAAVLAAVGVAATLAVDRTGLVVAALLFVLVVPFEKMFPRHHQPIRRPQVGTDVAHAIVSTPLGAAATVVAAIIGFLSLAWLPGLALRPFVTGLPPLVQMVLGAVLFDFLIYWAHRFGHEVPFMWRFHSIHHSTEHLDWVSGFRSHPLDGVLLAPPFVLLLVAGFSVEVTGVLAAVQFLTGLFAHANVRWRWRRLHKIVFTPEFHHWHHSNEPEAWNSNYAVFLPLWDLAFGTYYLPADRRPQFYGVNEPIPAGLAHQLWHPFRGLPNPLRQLRHPKRAIRLLVDAIRRGIDQMVASARRPRRRVLVPF